MERMCPSRTITLPPLVSTLLQAEHVLETARAWNAVNTPQAVFLQETYPRFRENPLPDMDGIASWDHSRINQFLQDHGSSLRLDRFESNEFGVATFFRMLLKWIAQGQPLSLQTPYGVFPGFRLDSQGAYYFTARSHPHPVVCLDTQSGDEVFLTKATPEHTSASDLDLFAMVTKLLMSLKRIPSFGGVQLPMVDLDQMVDLTWLLGMWTTTHIRGSLEQARIAKALQQTKLRMNHVGAHIQSTTAMKISLDCAIEEIRDLVIDEPFLLAIRRPSKTFPAFLPLFLGLIAPSDWKDPGEDATH